VGRTPQGNLLHLQDVGEASYGFNTFATQGTDIHGYPAITVGVYQTPSSNALQVSEAVVELMNQVHQPGATRRHGE